MEFEEKLILW
uniref:Uncharacterized protein n=1 Tax=Anguilla anguilla TaxID=7936 RepID=A0A0E9TEX2_ANGAN